MDTRILHMHRTEVFREEVIESFWHERMQRKTRQRIERQELGELIAKIHAFYPPTNEGQDAYGKWLEAGPDNNASFLQYCRDEWDKIQAEMDFSDYLVGKHMFFSDVNTGLQIG